MKALISKLLDAGIMVSLDGDGIHYKAFREVTDKETAQRLLLELKRRKQEAIAYLARQEKIYRAYQALFRAMSELHRSHGVPRYLVQELLRLDKRVDANEPGALEGIQNLRRKVDAERRQFDGPRREGVRR